MKKTIFLVEDSPDAVELTKRAMSCGKETEVVAVADGERALDYLFSTGGFSRKNPNERPDLVLLDIRLPKISGLEVLEKIRSDERTRLIPVVMLTNSKLRSDIRRSYSLGANSYIVKSVKYERFIEVLGKVCEYWLFINES